MPEPIRRRLERLCQTYPSWVPALLLAIFGVLMLTEDARERFFGPWVWIFEWPGPKAIGAAWIALGTAHCLLLSMRSRFRFVTKALSGAANFVIATQILRYSDRIGPAPFVYAALFGYVIWAVRFRKVLHQKVD